MGHSPVWIFKKINEHHQIRVLGDESAAHLARVFSLLEPGRWSVKAEEAPRFQLVENWIFERSEASQVVDFANLEAIKAPDQIFLDKPKVPEDKQNSFSSAEKGSGVKAPKPPLPVPQASQGGVASDDWLNALAPELRIKADVEPAEVKKAFPTDDDPTNPGMSLPGELVQLVSEESKGEAIQLPINKKDKRRFARVNGRLRVVLISGKRSFRTHSVNVSKGGILLEHQIPLRLIGETCKVVIGSPDMTENLEFLARVVGSNERPAALEFTESKEEFLEKLESWLDKLKSKQAA